MPKAQRLPPASRVILVGFFSGKVKEYEALMEELAKAVTAGGGKVLETFVQRRGVSDGGVSAMDKPFSTRTLIREGKMREVAAACTATGADLVIFFNPLTDRQREALQEELGCQVLSRENVQL